MALIKCITYGSFDIIQTRLGFTCEHMKENCSFEYQDIEKIVNVYNENKHENDDKLKELLFPYFMKYLDFNKKMPDFINKEVKKINDKLDSMTVTHFKATYKKHTNYNHEALTINNDN
jgi:hypothetical protein